MFSLKVFTLLVLATVASASDLERGLELMACAKAAITTGVPELGIPSHEPYVTLTTTFNWNGSIGSIVQATVNITNMTWAGLARWNLTATQLNQDSDTFAAFDFVLDWEWMQFNGTYRLEEQELVFDQVQEGTFSVELNETSWIGSINMTKEGLTPSDENGTIDDTQIKWHAEEVGVILTGLEISSETIEAAMAAGIKNAFNNDLLGNAVGDFVKMRLKTIWWDTGKVWDLGSWCKANNITTIN